MRSKRNTKKTRQHRHKTSFQTIFNGLREVTANTDWVLPMCQRSF